VPVSLVISATALACTISRDGNKALERNERGERLVRGVRHVVDLPRETALNGAVPNLSERAMTSPSLNFDFAFRNAFMNSYPVSDRDVSIVAVIWRRCVKSRAIHEECINALSLFLDLQGFAHDPSDNYPFQNQMKTWKSPVRSQQFWFLARSAVW
jgi:hypothetical protein